MKLAIAPAGLKRLTVAKTSFSMRSRISSAATFRSYAF